jgi:hypothetical protein
VSSRILRSTVNSIFPSGSARGRCHWRRPDMWNRSRPKLIRRLNLLPSSEHISLPQVTPLVMMSMRLLFALVSMGMLSAAVPHAKTVPSKYTMTD